MVLLTSELSQDPWKGKVVSWNNNKAKLCKIEGGDLPSKFEFLKTLELNATPNRATSHKVGRAKSRGRVSRYAFLHMEESKHSRGDVNPTKVFDQVLDFAASEKLSRDRMVERVFVFTDMTSRQAYSCSLGLSGTYRRRGYSVSPDAVYWNVKDDSQTRTWMSYSRNTKNMINGFSEDSLTALVDRITGLTLDVLVGLVPGAEYVMESAIFGELYDNLYMLD